MLEYRSAAVQDSYCTFHDKRHMMNQQIYILIQDSWIFKAIKDIKEARNAFLTVEEVF